MTEHKILRSCPICGKQPIVFQKHEGKFVVSCHIETETADTFDKAMDIWNRAVENFDWERYNKKALEQELKDYDFSLFPWPIIVKY